jgi:hypothetical protein
MIYITTFFKRAQLDWLALPDRKKKSKLLTGDRNLWFN